MNPERLLAWLKDRHDWASQCWSEGVATGDRMYDMGRTIAYATVITQIENFLEGKPNFELQ